MTLEPKDRQPGDLILDRAMPNATPAEREAARAHLDRLAALIARMLMRAAAEDSAEPIRTIGDARVQ